MDDRATISRQARWLKNESANLTSLPSLFFLTDEDRHSDADLAEIIGRLPEDVGVVFRHYRHRQRAALAATVARLCARRQRVLLIGADPGLARNVGAAGVHLPHWCQNQAVLRKKAAALDVITVASHSLPDLRRAVAMGAGAAFLSPLFPTKAYPQGALLGPNRFSAWRRQVPIPVYALGGLTAENTPRMRGTGAAGLCAIGLFEQQM